MDSIDDLVEVEGASSLEGKNLHAEFGMTPESVMRAHASNLIAWYENDYYTRILHSNLSFPLLREIVRRCGDDKAARVLRAEIVERLASNHPSVIRAIFDCCADLVPKEEIIRIAKGGQLRGADLRGADLDGADLRNADLSGVDLIGADLSYADLRGADLSYADLRGADLTGAILSDAIFAETKMVGAKLEHIEAHDTNFSEADLTDAQFSHSDLSGADFSKCVLNGADFKEAKLHEASVEGAKGIKANFAEADLTKLRASEGCNFSQSSFRKVTGFESMWHDAILSEADFSFSQMQGADFTKAFLQKADLSASDMKYTRFRKADMKLAKLLYMNLFEGSLEKADLTGADLTGSNMYAVEFLDAVVEHTRMERTNLRMTKLHKG